MKKTFALKPLALSMAVAAASAVSMVPATAQAEVSYNASVSNFYLWRGLDISEGQGVLSGGVDYAADSGLYAGMWASSEAGGSEFDLYGGWAGSFGDFGIDLGYFAYYYPTEVGYTVVGSDLEFVTADSGFDKDDGTLITELFVGLSYSDFGAGMYINTDADDNDGYKYLSLDYGYDKFGFHFGKTMLDDGDEYSDVNVSYAATDAFTITVSKAMGDAVEDTSFENPVINLSYALPF